MRPWGSRRRSGAGVLLCRRAEFNCSIRLYEGPVELLRSVRILVGKVYGQMHPARRLHSHLPDTALFRRTESIRGGLPGNIESVGSIVTVGGRASGPKVNGEFLSIALDLEPVEAIWTGAFVRPFAHKGTAGNLADVCRLGRLTGLCNSGCG